MKAWQILERDGWCQGRMTNDKGQHCLIGALGLLSSDDYPKWDKAISLALATKYNFVSWNDAPGRTAEEVIGLLKKLDI